MVMHTCGILFSHWPFVYHEDTPLSCQRPEGHQGPHCVQRPSGQWYLWQARVCHEPTEGCCYSEDPEAHCCVVAEIPPDVAAKYLADPELVGEGWESQY